MQLNMGEGKTSVIMPMVAALLSNGSQLARIIVLNSLFNMNYTSLVHCMGGLLNKRVYAFPFHREMAVTGEHMATFAALLHECMGGKHVVLSVPEHCLSLKLKSIEMCDSVGGTSRSSSSSSSSNSSGRLCQQLIDVQRLLQTKARDILDESDELLSVKYQLVYSVGRTCAIDGESLRWQCAQDVLKLAAEHCAALKKTTPQFRDSIEFLPATAIDTDTEAKCPQAFPLVRLVNEAPFASLCALICRSFLTKQLPAMQTHMVELRSDQLELFTGFVLENTMGGGDAGERVKSECADEPRLSLILHILRGLLTYQVLYVVLSKRWKVEYGVNATSARRLLQAVPYRAKDVPAPRAQYAHADICIGLTTLSYYYSGLSDAQLEQLFGDALAKDVNASAVYAQLIEEVERRSGGQAEVHASIRHYAGLNLADASQKSEHLYPTMRRLPGCVDYWLGKFVFPREAKEFEHKLSTSAWDLCTLNDTCTTGFSGTNDSRLLLPTSMRYHEVSELADTSGRVIANLIEATTGDTCCYEARSAEDVVDVAREIVKRMVDNSSRVLLDVGALVLTMSNRQLVSEWLSLLACWRDERATATAAADAAVYFEENELVVLERASGLVAPFETSIYKQQLDKCVVYLDEIHTRGTDLKIPLGVCATVTLGHGLTKDRLVQACMRMRQLGVGHRVHFIASTEVNTAILRMKERNTTRHATSQQSVTCIDVIEWTINNR